MNIYEKIQKVKLELSKRELKKSGENKFSNFKYYELGDFLPSIIELCDKHKLFTQITFADDLGILSIIDTESKYEDKNGEIQYDIVQYTSPLKEIELKGANAIQALGGVQTYLRRYLYMNAFDIVEADMFDSAKFEKEKKKKVEKNTLDVLVEDCKKAFKVATDEDKATVGSLMKTLGYTSFTALSQAQNKDDIISLANSLCVTVPSELTSDKKEEK